MAGEETASSRQSKPEDIPVLIDVLILRPVGLASCAVGLAATVFALPFAIPSGSVEKVTQALIREPFDYTFRRPLGESTTGGISPNQKILFAKQVD